MAILNYTTSISTEKTVMEIQSRLARAGASAVLSEYEDGVLSHISFRMETPHGSVSFRLPANIRGVLSSMEKDKKVPKALKTKEQAARVAWRIIKDWVEAQIAIIEAGMATLTQVFLPYAQTPDGTVYECFERRGIPALEHSSKGESNAKNTD